MQVMVRVLFALLLTVCLVTLTQQRPANQQPLLDYVIECEPLPNGKCILVAKPRTGPPQIKDPVSGIKVVTDRSEVSLGPGQDTALTCYVNTQHDLAYIKTIWYKWAVANKNTGEWMWRSRRTEFNGNAMSITITGSDRDARYRCKACVTDQPADQYSAHHDHGDSCTSAEINVRTGVRGKRSS